MTIRTTAALALALTWLGCSGSEPEPAKQQPAPAAAPSAAAPAAAPTMSPRRPVATIPTIHVPPEAYSGDGKPRYPETPCDRKEAGWKWVGNLVEDGNCVVGPCKCEKE